jgi:acetyl esterase/lipase
MRNVNVKTMNMTGSAFTALLVSALAVATASAQNAPPAPPAAPPPAAATSAIPHAPLPPLPAPLNVPKPGPQTDAPYAPQPILPGGVVVTLFPPDSPYLKKDKINIPEQYSMSGAVAGRISNIIHIHNPSIEVHLVDGGMNTGAAVILIAGGGHNTLNVGGEGADFVPFFYNYGVNTIILRSRLRSDGYNPQTDEVYDTQQAIRMVRAYAKEWRIDPNKIGVMGFSAGAELVAAAAVLYDDWDRKNSDPSDPFAGTTSRPDFAGIIYPGPSPFTPRRTPPPIPRNVPPAFLACAGSDDQGHAVWATEYFDAMLALHVPNIEMHIYATGRHPGDPLPDGSRMTGGLTSRNFTPYGTWQDRFIDWFRDLGFLQKPGVPTKAALDVQAYMSRPAPGQGRGGRGGAPGAPGATPPAGTPPTPPAGGRGGGGGQR